MNVAAVLVLALATTAVIIAVHRLDDLTGLPAPALLTVVGIAYSLLPGPNVTLDPHVVLTLVLPPLLYSAALDSSLLAIRATLRPVVSLSVLLVLATALAVGLGFAAVVPGATLAAGVALGAAVAPPDPVAALAVGRRVGLPPRLLTLVQGEGLLNDATALTTLTVAVAAATGGGFSLGGAVGEFVVSAAGGVAVGLVTALLVRLARPLLTDPLSTNAVSLATPFGAYLLGESLHVSGVLAVVVAGLVVGHTAPRLATGAARLQTGAVWRLVDYLLEGFVFLLIGQQLPTVVDGLSAYPTGTVVVAVALSVGTVVLLRPLWLGLTQLLPRALHARLGGPDADAAVAADVADATGRPGGAPRDGRLSGREVLVLSWSGTRGVISLAAIFTLPLTTDGGAPFPVRDLLLFCTFVVVLVTLVGQGVTFAPLVRAVGLRADATDQARLRNQARTAAVEAALRRLPDIAAGTGADAQVQAALRQQLEARLVSYRGRLDALEAVVPGEAPRPGDDAAVRARRTVLDVEREELLRWRDTGRLPDEGLRLLERELDHQERLLPDRPGGP